MATEPRHRHEHSSWLIAGGYIEWCYQCGAWRQLRHTFHGMTTIKGKEGRWNCPAGIGAPNPAMKEATSMKDNTTNRPSCLGPTNRPRRIRAVEHEPGFGWIARDPATGREIWPNFRWASRSVARTVVNCAKRETEIGRSHHAG